MKLTYPTRNEARGILLSLSNQNHSRSTSIKELCSYCILCYEKKHNLSFVTFVFTNALVDMFPDMSVDDENYVETSTMLKNRSASGESIDSFFINCIGEKLENFIEKFTEEEQSFKVQISILGPSTYDTLWFNNSDKFIHQLLSSYQEFKQRNGMLFQKDDIEQIPIDYAVVICYKHFIQNGYLNNKIISSIIKAFTDAANACLNMEPLKYSDIEYNVSKDILNPKSVKAAIDLIKQL
jgi:hypothetical protein